jgi:hypothetical protein
MNKTILKIDSSLLSNSSCALKVYLMGYKGLRYKGPYSADIIFGSALHKFAEHWHKTKDEVMAKSIAIKYFINNEKAYTSRNKHLREDFLIEACIAYERAWETKKELLNTEILLHNNSPLVEVKFAIPYYTSDDIDVVLCGTLDQIAKVDDRMYLINDIKKSSATDRDKFLQNFSLSLQLMVYRMAVEWHATQYPDSIFTELTKGTIGARIIGVFVNSNKPVEVECSKIYFFKDEMLTEVSTVIKTKVDALVDSIRSGERPLKEGIITGECGSYAGCPFFGACNNADDRIMLNMFDTFYHQETYDPLLFR